MDKLKKILGSIIAIPFGLLLLGFGVGTSGYLPDHVLLLVDESSGEYFPAFESFEESGRKLMTAEEAREKDYEPNHEAKENSAFFEDRGSVSRRFLSNLGLFPKKQSRWNEDGTWNH